MAYRPPKPAARRKSKKAGELPVTYVDDVCVRLSGDEEEIIMRLKAHGEYSTVLMMTTENFYAVIRKLMRRAFPSMRGRTLH